MSKFKKTKPDRGKDWGTFRRMKCPYCGMTYRNFRMPITRTQVYHEQKSDQKNPNHPRTDVTRNTWLGRMHNIKMECWKNHKRLCGVVHGKIAPYEVFGKVIL